MPLFRKRQGQPSELPEHLRRKYIQELIPLLTVAKVATADRLFSSIQARYHRDEEWSRKMAGAVVSALFGEPPADSIPQDFLIQHEDIINAECHALSKNREMAETVGMAVREHALLFGSLISGLEEATKTEVLLSLEYSDEQTGIIAWRAMEAIEKFDLPVIGTIESPGTFRNRINKYVKPLLR